MSDQKRAIQADIATVEADIKMQERQLAEKKLAQKEGEALRTLMLHPDFKMIFLDGYLSNYLTAQVRYLARAAESNRDAVQRNIDSVSNLQRYLDDIDRAFMNAPLDIRDIEQQLAELHDTRDQYIEELNKL